MNHPPNQPLRVLHLEDSPRDAELIRDNLEADNFACTIRRVDNRGDFEAALADGTYDIVLCDFNLPAYDGVSALKFVRGRDSTLPVILISGTLGEEDAVKCLKMGATDYLIKERLHRLGPAVRRALLEAEDQRNRRRAEEALVASEERFRLLIERSSDLVCETSLAGQFFYGSPNFRTSLGYEPSDLVLRNGLELVHPDDLPGLRAAFVRGEARTELRVRHRNGSFQWFEITARIFKTAARTRRVGIMARDITERRQLEEQLRQSQKMESIGQLAGGIAHDFNNILTIIQGRTSLLSSDLELAPEARESASEALEAANRAASLTRQLLAFSRKQLMQPRNLQLNTVVDDMTRMLRRTLGNQINFLVEAEPDLPPIHADQGMMEQVLLNLAVNARDAMPSGGSLTISTFAVPGDESGGRAERADLPRGPAVCLRVSDTGSGIPPEIASRVFEPFFTTKEVHKGTGLGLATVHGIVKQHHGSIRLTSEVGHGTTFQIILPASGCPDEPAGESIPEEHTPGGGQTILVVDDEPALRCVVDLILTEGGYQVLQAGSGQQALAMFEEADSARPDLLLTDMAMPGGMDGKELVQRLRANRAGLPVIFTSGYGVDFIAESLGGEEDFHFLQKPFTPAMLIQKVRECLSCQGRKRGQPTPPASHLRTGSD